MKQRTPIITLKIRTLRVLRGLSAIFAGTRYVVRGANVSLQRMSITADAVAFSQLIL